MIHAGKRSQVPRGGWMPLRWAQPPSHSEDSSRRSASGYLCLPTWRRAGKRFQGRGVPPPVVYLVVGESRAGRWAGGGRSSNACILYLELQTYTTGGEEDTTASDRRTEPTGVAPAVARAAGTVPTPLPTLYRVAIGRWVADLGSHAAMRRVAMCFGIDARSLNCAESPGRQGRDGKVVARINCCEVPSRLARPMRRGVAPTEGARLSSGSHSQE